MQAQVITARYGGDFHPGAAGNFFCFHVLFSVWPHSIKYPFAINLWEQVGKKGMQGILEDLISDLRAFSILEVQTKNSNYDGGVLWIIKYAVVAVQWSTCAKFQNKSLLKTTTQCFRLSQCWELCTLVRSSRGFNSSSQPGSDVAVTEEKASKAKINGENMMGCPDIVE